MVEHARTKRTQDQKEEHEMPKRFSVENLPKDVREKIYCIHFVREGEMADEETLGECWLIDGWLFDGESHYASFNSRQELIDDIRSNVVPE